MAARGLVNGRGPLRRSGRDLVFSPPEPLFSLKIIYCINEERLFKTLIHDILEQIALETFCVTHLSEDLAVAAYDTLDGII